MLRDGSLHRAATFRNARRRIATHRPAPQRIAAHRNATSYNLETGEYQ